MSVPPTRDLLQKALGLHRRGALAEAAAIYAEVQRADPRDVDAPYYLATISCQQGRFAEGAALARRALANNPQDLRASVLLGQALGALERNEEALATFEGVIALAPDLALAHGHRADVFSKLGRNVEAIDGYDRALTLEPSAFHIWFKRGTALLALGRQEAAIASFDCALDLKPDFAPGRLMRAQALMELRRYAEALDAIDHVIAAHPTLAQAWLGRATALSKLDRQQEAASACDRALALLPNFAEAWLGRGNIAIALKQYDAALACYDKALSLKPDMAAAWLGRGSLHFERRQHRDALAAYERALAIKPDLVEAWHARGNVLFELKEYAAARAAYDTALGIKPDLDHAGGARLMSKLKICDWTNLHAEIEACLADINDGRLTIEPFVSLTLSASSAEQLNNARKYIQEQRAYPPLRRGEAYAHDRIRIAYLSADFREHAIGYLTAGLFERHDRSRFEITAISFGQNDNSSTRRRLEAAFDRFIDVADKTDQDIAETIRRHEIDIAVDLTGFTKGARLGVLARRPAPIQVNYLGYLGTMGADYIDYVIADKIALPFDQGQYYIEKIVHLPHCFLVNDDKLAAAPHTPSRSDVGLPDDGLVFCSFNNSYKLAPAIFELWMRLLQRVEGSVLWLVKANSEMEINLRRAAQNCGSDPDRLVFASHVPLAEHMARQRLADLFLDTAPYNAGATAAAALWSGVPVLTMLGSPFVGRMAASLLHAVGLPELITHTLQDYEALALELAAEPAKLAAIRGKLKANRLTTPLFDTPLFTRGIEAAYTAMYERHRAGLSPEPITVTLLKRERT